MPTLGVEVVILKENQVLLTLREDIAIWCLPGGMVEDGETVIETAVREAYEEAGVHIALGRLVGVYSRPNWRQGGDHGLVFAAQHVGGTPQPLDGEALAVRYFPLDALPQTLFWWQRERIADAVAGKTAIVREQDIVFPLGQMTRPELRAELATYSEAEMAALIRYLCVKIG